MDYTITWNYICSKMEQMFGIKTDSCQKFSMGEIHKYINCIWDEYYKEVKNNEMLRDS